MVEPSFNNSQSIHHGIDDVEDDLIEELKLEPHIGMRFDSLDEATQFYKEFSRIQGFGFRIRSMSKGKNDDKWIVRDVNNNHNHHMVSPKSVSYIRCHKKMTHAAKSLVEKFNEEGLPIGRVAVLFNTDKTLKVASFMETEMLAELEAPLLGSNIQTSMDDQVQLNELQNLNIGDPRKSNTKGRKKDDQKETQNKRLKSGIELSCSQPGKKKCKCKNCGEYGHYQTSCKK
ncbi:hypothetical protein ACFE04_013630 [Oxalis oulophora]